MSENTSTKQPSQPIVIRIQAHELLATPSKQQKLPAGDHEVHIVGSEPAPNRPVSSLRITDKNVTDIIDPQMVSIETDLGALFMGYFEILTLHIY